MDLSPLVLSFQVATVATVVATGLGVFAAAFLSRARFPGRQLVDAIITAPMVLPPTVLGYYLLVALGRFSMLGKGFHAVTGTYIVFTKTGAICAAAVGAFPIVVKSAKAALEDVDVTLVRAARTLGAGPLRAFMTVQLPLAARGIVAGVMLAFARSLGDFGVTLMVAGDIPGETQTASLAIFDAILAHRETEALVMVGILTAITVSILYTVNSMTAKRDGR